MRRRRGVSPSRALCARGRASCAEALGVTIKHNGLALDRPPFELRARAEKPEIAVGPRIGITKAVDEPWRYGLKGSQFLSKPFKALIRKPASKPNSRLALSLEA